MTDALETFRAQMGAMTNAPGWNVDRSSGVDLIFDGRQAVAHMLTSNAQHDATGIVTAVRVAQYLAGGEAREALAEKLADRLFGRYVGWRNLTDYGKFPYREAADAILTALAQIATHPPSAQEDAG